MDVLAELEHPRPLDQLTIKVLTAAFRRKITKEPTCKLSWPKRLNDDSMPWHAIAFNYKLGLMTPSDFKSHYKCILHGCFLSRVIKPKNGSTKCRLCGLADEHIMHFHECSILKPIWSNWLNLIKLDDIRALNAMLIYHAIDKGEAIKPILNATNKIAWRFIIAGLAARDEDNKLFNSDQVWRATLWRLLTIVRQQAHGVRLLLQRAKARDTDEESLIKSLAPRLARLHPLAHVANDGELTIHPELIKQLNEANITHNHPPINQLDQ